MVADLLITTYNRPDALEAVLVSVLAQTVMPNQVIVADDGSSAVTQQVIQKYQLLFKGRLMHAWHEDRGFRAAEIRNKAIAMAASEYLIIIDGDMILEKHFVQDHIANASPGYFLQGGRTLLTEEKTRSVLVEPTKPFVGRISDKGIENRLEKRLTAFRSVFLSRMVKKEMKNKNKVRSCNMSFYIEDIKRVNGFNNEFVGWGREDSEFVQRLLNIGLKGMLIKFVAIGYHLYHREEPRASLRRNDELLTNTINNKLIYCENGLSKFLKGNELPTDFKDASTL